MVVNKYPRYLRIWLTRLHPCSYPIYIMWWFIRQEVTPIQSLVSDKFHNTAISLMTHHVIWIGWQQVNKNVSQIRLLIVLMLQYLTFEVFRAKPKQLVPVHLDLSHCAIWGSSMCDFAPCDWILQMASLLPKGYSLPSNILFNFYITGSVRIEPYKPFQRLMTRNLSTIGWL